MARHWVQPYNVNNEEMIGFGESKVRKAIVDGKILESHIPGSWFASYLSGCLYCRKKMSFNVCSFNIHDKWCRSWRDVLCSMSQVTCLILSVIFGGDWLLLTTGTSRRRLSHDLNIQAYLNNAFPIGMLTAVDTRSQEAWLYPAATMYY
jgi:hypothetical protein